MTLDRSRRQRRAASSGPESAGPAVETPDQDELPVAGVPLPGLTLPVRPSLRVGAVDDPAEVEAESVADLVVDALRRSPAADGVPGAAAVGPVGPVEPGHEHGPVRRAATVGAAGGPVDAEATASIEQLRGGGQPLPGGIRRSMESAFGTDLSGVRVHTGPTASRLNSQLGAHAFTTGNDIVFADGLPDVSRPDGQRLMAHELTHVLQHRGADTLSALRRHAVQQPAPEAVEHVQLGTVAFTLRPAEPADPATAAIRRVFDVAVKPCVVGEGKVYYIENIVISDVPKGPSKSGMPEHGGKSFHHESAYTWLERQVTQYAGKPLAEVVADMVKYGLGGYPQMADPGADAMAQVMALNSYFHGFLVAEAKRAQGWLGPTNTHSKQGGKISAAIRALKSKGWTKETVFGALTESFEPGPQVQGRAKFEAARRHSDAFYEANKLLLEQEGPEATIDLREHEDIVELIYDWDTQFWDESFVDM